VKDSKTAIFKNLRSRAVSGDTAYPSYSHPHTGIADPRATFKTVTEEAGGECHFVADFRAAKDLVANLGVYRTAKQICSYVKEVAEGNFNAEARAVPHECRDVGLAIVRGEFGVAENAAVWVKGGGLKHRGLLFLSENLILVIEGKDIVRDMEEAYARIDFAGLTWGCFISGPSKTADIEQCLVVGAHGAKSLIVVVVG
jgi:L-lactate dehydrogenase complex protein LldG